MADGTRHQPLLVRSKSDEHLILKLLNLLSDQGIEISDDHKKILHNRRRFTNSTPLMENCQKKLISVSEADQKIIVDILPIAAAYANKKNRFGRNSLHFSANIRNKELLDIFLKAGADVSAKDKNNQTPLHVSAMKGYKEIVETLLKAGANANDEDFLKKTPLHWSVRNGHKEIVSILLNAGANVDARNSRNETPLHVSIMFKKDDVAELLIFAGASDVASDDQGKSVQNYVDERFRRDPRSVNTFHRIHSWIYARTNNVETVQKYHSSQTKIKQTETISTTYTVPDSQTIQLEDNFSNKGQDDIPRGSSMLQSSGASLIESAVASSCPQSEKTQCINDNDLQEANNIKQQFQDHIAKFTPEHSEGWDMSCSSHVNAMFKAGEKKIMMPTTINIKQVKNIKNIKNITNNHGPATNNIKHAGVFAQNCEVVVRDTKKVESEDGDDDDDKGSSVDINSSS